MIIQIKYQKAAILSRLILTTTDYEDVVADPMCGTGSTLITATKLFRKVEVI